MESSPMRYVVACALAIVGLTTAGAAEIYCNVQGRDCRDRPSGAANIARNTTATQPAASASSPASDASSGDPVAAQRQQEATQASAQEAVQKDLVDKRSEQCKKAQQNYQRSIEASTIYTTDKDGTKHVLTDAEATQYRLTARQAIEQTCKTGG